jgi:glycosyltransferase involved in cell wall biosynthesis
MATASRGPSAALHVALVFFDPFTPGGVQSQIAGRIDHLGFPGGPVRFTLFGSEAPKGAGRWPHVRTEIVRGWPRLSVAVYEYTASRRIAGALEKVHREDPFDLVELHAGGPGPFVGSWCRKRRVPLVAVAHSLRFFSHPDDGQRFEVHLWHRWSNGKAFGFARRIVAVSGAIRDELVRFGVPGEKVVVLRTATESAAAGPGFAVPNPPGPLRLLFVGRPSPDKGLDLLLDAVDDCVRNRGVTLRLRVAGVSAGDGERARGTRRRGLPVEFLGSLSPVDVRREIGESDLLVIPSRYDPCPVVATEGLAAGALILASDAGGIPEIVRNGETGVVVSRGDAAAIAAAIERIAGCPTAFAGLRIAARAASREFLWATRAREVLDLYREVA